MTIATADPARGARLPAIDIARGVAIVAMVIYHSAYDLSSARLIAVDVQASLGWTIFARLIAGSFLFLVGVGLVLASASGTNWPRYFRRLAFIVAGALLVTVSTWWFEPRAFVFFGILHQIALASVLALPFLRLPSLAVAASAAVVIVLPFVFRSAVFDGPLVWTGLAVEPPVSVDFVPVFPWFGVVLAGVVGGRWVMANETRIATWRPGGAWARWLACAGRWSLLIYLIHQPLLVGAISLAAQVLPVNEGAARANFNSQCMAACSREAATCEAFCTCMFDDLWGTELFAMSSLEEMSPAQRETFDGVLRQCTPPEEGAPGE